MSTSFLLTSAVLLAGVAARPVHNEKTDDLADMVRSPQNGDAGRQAYLGRLPSESESFNSLQLHDLHDITEARTPDDPLAGSASPKLKGTVPDPGLQSPYFGAQRHLSVFDTDLLDAPSLSPNSPKPPELLHGESSNDDNTQPPLKQPEYSPIVVYLIASCVTSLVLLGVVVFVIHVSQLYRRTVLQNPVWQAISHRGKKNEVATSEKEKVSGRNSKLIPGTESKEEAIIAAREIPSVFLPSDPPADLSEKDASDPPEIPIAESSTLGKREASSRPGLIVVLKAWTLDNWVTHFMVALFGWIGMLFKSGKER